MIKMPAPSTYGDKRPAAPTMPAPMRDWLGKDEYVHWKFRVLSPDARPMPEIQTYRQTGGPLYLTRFRYNGVWMSGTARSEVEGVEIAQQFYMNETRQGLEDSVPEVVDPQ